jgi:hypothetical protein
MKAKLIKKSEIHYDLMIDTHGLYTSTYQWTSNGNLLSLKNCQAIENGYDLDELVNEVYPIPENSILPIITMNMASRRAFKAGFQKALSILGDKKFSEEDIREAFAVARHIGKNSIAYEFEEWFDRHMKQQTEWDVEIVMEEVSIGDKYTPEPKPKLDADGRLILKRVV